LGESSSSLSTSFAAAAGNFPDTIRRKRKAAREKKRDPIVWFNLLVEGDREGLLSLACPN
jgi:hypothetical protein